MRDVAWVAPLGRLTFACLAVVRGLFGCAACGGRGGTGPGASGDETSARAGDARAFAALASRGAAIAPGMHESARARTVGGDVRGARGVEVARAEGRDTCVRVAYEATSPVVAQLVDRAGDVLAVGGAPATAGVLGERGPVCVRKGDSVRAVAAVAGGGVVRWVAWESP